MDSARSFSSKGVACGQSCFRASGTGGYRWIYLTGSVPEPFTCYQEIRAVPAGSMVWVNHLGASEPKNYFSIARVFHEARREGSLLTEHELREVVHDTLLDSLRHHLISDVPVSAFLS